jgi:EF-P beta-lysylation protein EpmB
MQQPTWQSKLKEVINDPDYLLEMSGIPASYPVLSEKVLKSFPLRVPIAFMRRIKNGDPDDPLLRQILPTKEEEESVPGFTTDPLSEQQTQIIPGLLQKYQGRALLLVTGVCAIHCRYCFRRHFPYADSNPAKTQFQQAIDHLRQDTSITEVILSGGDPLSLSDQRLSVLSSKLAEIPHIKRLRIHSRIPIVLPERINDQTLLWLGKSRLKTVLVVHVNHPNELDHDVAVAIKKIREANVTLFNQSVLLKGINDSVDILATLSEKLFDMGIIPYYLHMLDPVEGVAHFEVKEDLASKIINELRKKLPGYLVPKLVRESAGTAYKIPVELTSG